MKLEKRKPSNDDVHQWLKTMNGETGLPVSRVDHNHWQVGMSNPTGQYTMDIKDQGEWVSMATVLGRDVEGRKRAPFYRKLLELSGKLNGSHIGIQGDNVILTREEPKEDLNQLSFYRSMSLLDRGQEVATPEVLEEMKRNNLKPKRREP
jgi:hypothetical protein